MSATLGLADFARALQEVSSPSPPALTHENCLWADPLDGFTFAYSRPAALEKVHLFGDDWASQCQKACEKSALHAFLKLRPNSFEPVDLKLLFDISKVTIHGDTQFEIL